MFLFNGVSLQPEGIAIDSSFLLTFKGNNERGAAKQQANFSDSKILIQQKLLHSFCVG